MQKKYGKDPEGNDVVYYNNRTMHNKALKAYLKGMKFFKYKGEQYAVPIINNKVNK